MPVRPICFNTPTNLCKDGYPNAACVVYTGANLICSGITTNDRLDVILEKIDAVLCDVSGGTIYLEAGAGLTLTGAGTQFNPYIYSHADTSSVADLDTSGAQVIDTVTFDTFGHVTAITTRNLTAGDIGAEVPITANNGLSRVGNTIQLGGNPLIQATSIDGNVQTFSLTNAASIALTAVVNINFASTGVGSFTSTGNMMLGGLSTLVSALNVTTTLTFDADITPPQITSDQHNYNPAGFSTASILKLSSDATRNITGIIAAVDGRFLMIYNTGAFPLVFKNEDVNSSGGSRFALNADFTLEQNQATIIHYDGTANRWRMHGGVGGGGSIVGSLREEWISPWKTTNYNLAPSLFLTYKNENKQTVTLAAGEAHLHSLRYVDKQLFALTRDFYPVQLIRFNDPNDLTDYDAQSMGADYDGGADLIYVPSKGKLYATLEYIGANPAFGFDIVEIDPVTLAQTVRYSLTYPGNVGVGFQGLAFDETYLYALWRASVGDDKIIKLDLATWTPTVTTVTGMAGGHALGYDGTHLYVTDGSASPSSIYKIDPTTLAIVNSTSFAAGDNSATDDIVVQGDYVWVGLEATHGYILRIKKSDLSITRVNTGTASGSFGIFFDGKYVWNLHNVSPGVITRIDPETLEIYKHTLDTGENSPNEMTTDGQRLFITCWLSPSKVIRIPSPPLLTYVSSQIVFTPQNLFETIAVAGQSNVVADSPTDTLTFVAGGAITITTDAGTDSITFAHTDTSSVSNLDTSGAQVIDTLTFDTYGHVQTVTTRNLTTGDIGAEVPLTFDNWLTRTTNNVRIGGNLVVDTEVYLNGFSFSIMDNGESMFFMDVSRLVEIGDRGNNFTNTLFTVDDNVGEIIVVTPTFKINDSSLAGANNGYRWTLIDDTTGEGAWGANTVPLSSLTAALATNNIDNSNFAQVWDWPTLAGQTGLTLSSTSTVGATNHNVLLVSTSGANAAFAGPVYAARFSNARTGAFGTSVGIDVASSGTGNTGGNIGAAFFASGSTSNIGLVVNTLGAHTTNIAGQFIATGSTNNYSLDLKGPMRWNGTTSGSITITPAAASGTFVLTLPTALVAGGVLTDVAGNGVLSFVVPSGGSQGFQDVLNVDPDLTGANVIDGNSGNLTFTNFNDIVFSSSNEMRFELPTSIGMFAAGGGTAVVGALSLQGDLTPAQITANEDDYNPTNSEYATSLRLSSDASRDITGIANGQDGRLLFTYNIGTEDIVFKAEDLGSTAINRFAIPADFTLLPEQGMLWQYDGVSDRWRATSSTSSGGSQTPWVSDINADGFVLYGNDDANGDLTLRTTSSATKTTSYIFLADDGGEVLVGGTTDNGAYKFQVNGATYLGGTTRIPIGSSLEFGSTAEAIGGGGGNDLYYGSGGVHYFSIAGTNYFNMRAAGLAVKQGTTAATAYLHIGAGTAAANTAPLKLTAGTNLSALELGTIEYTDDGTTGRMYSTVSVAGAATRVPLGAPWTEVTGTSQSAVVNTGYIASNASLVTITIPTIAAVGDTVKIAGKGAGGWKVAQNASEIIHFGSVATTTGTGGSLESTNRYDAVELLCIVANTEWVVLSSVGTITIT